MSASSAKKLTIKPASADMQTTDTTPQYAASGLNEGGFSALFYDIQDNKWLIRIFRGTPSSTSLPFPCELAADDALVIEWKKLKPDESVRGSSATVTVVSPFDRTFVGLYTETNDTFMTVEKNGKLYWYGCLDAEQYEEPYSTNRGYEVTLTFSDFGNASRVRFDGQGRVTLDALIRQTVAAFAPHTLTPEIVYKTSLEVVPDSESSATPIPFDASQLSVISDLLRDDGTLGLPLDEALNAVLLPLGLRITQDGGKIYVYDDEALYREFADATIAPCLEWDGTNQRLGVAEVYKTVRITYSPAADTGPLDISLDEDKILRTPARSLLYKTGNDSTGDYAHVNGFYLNYDTADNAADQLPENLRILYPAAVCRFVPEYSSGAAGVAALVYCKKNVDRITVPATGDHYANPEYDKIEFSAYSVYDTGADLHGHEGPVMILDGGYVNPRKTDFMGRDKHHLRIKMSTLFDPRYNPFEAAAGDNEETAFKNFTERMNFAYVPVHLEVVDDDGNILCYYTNNARKAYDDGYSPAAYTGWLTGAPTAGWTVKKNGLYGGFADPKAPDSFMWLAYYDYSDRKKQTGMGGWAENRQCIGNYYGSLPKAWERRGVGEFIPLPPVGGHLRMYVAPKIYVTKSGWNMGDVDRGYPWPIRWVAFKAPQIDIVRNDGAELISTDTADYELTATVDPNAADDLDLSIKFGSCDASEQPIYRATYRLKIPGLTQERTVIAIRRAGITASIEEHLAGAVLSQCSTARTKLSGDTAPVSGISICCDSAMPGVALLPTSVRYNVREAYAETEFVEMRPLSFDTTQW